jgi:hypothetical protein
MGHALVDEVPEIHIELCSGYLGPVVGSDKKYAIEIFGQTMFASAAFIIAHPEQANDRVAVNLAGVEGALKVYEAIVASFLRSAGSSSLVFARCIRIPNQVSS